MFKELRVAGKIMGFSLQRENRFYFFGTSHATKEDLPRLFPQFEFCFLKQVHGRDVILAQPGEMPEADGHFTDVAGRALVVQSADCLPALLSGGELICAVHAGWRGMALNILGAAKACVPRINFAAIGPHILRQSFEVGSDVAEKLMAAGPRPGDSSLTDPAPDPSKRFFDLNKLAEAQLQMPGLTIAECLFDTKTNTLFHSYRRGREAKERQYSFVVIAPDLR